MATCPVTAVVTDGVSAAVLEHLLPSAAALGVRVIGPAPDAAHVAAFGPQLLIVKRQNIGTDQLTSWPRVRGVQKVGVITDNIDLEVLRGAGITVRTLVPPSAISVAEHTMALILAMSRNLRASMDAMHETSGLAPRKTSENVMAFDWAGITARPLHGKVLGLVGFGEIAYQVARRAKSFGLRVVYTKRRALPPYLERRASVRYLSFRELLRSADIVSLHAPHTPDTERMINGQTLAFMKRGGTLVNTARGGLLDEEAVAAAVASGHLAAVGLDVYDAEPLPLDSPLLQLPTAVLTPHAAGAGPDAMARCLTAALRRWAATLSELSHSTA